jgi:branched-chain amino acid transport system substrate-binding protein
MSNSPQGPATASGDSAPNPSSGTTVSAALSNPSANGISLALNRSYFRASDTLKIFLRIDGAMFQGITADLWVRIISPSGKVIYVGPNNILSDDAVGLKEAWTVEDVPPTTILDIPLSGIRESGAHNFQAILTRPGASPETMTSWITSASAQADIHGPYDFAGRKIIRLGTLLPLSGVLSQTGIASREAVRLAVNSINQIFGDLGLAVFVQLLTADSESLPPAAYRGFINLETLGADIIVGPDSSASVKVVGEVAKQKDLVYISASATSIELARADDNLIRLVPDDRHQAKALCETMTAEGVIRLAILSRTDTYGRSLTEEVSTLFRDAGGEAFFVRHYGKGDSDPASLTAELRDAVTKTLAAGADPGSVGVLLVSFSEAIDFLRAAAEDPALSTIRWYGTDGMALNANLLKDAAAAGFAAKTGFTCPITARGDNPTYAQIEQALTESLGFAPSPYALGFYDAAWLATLSVLMTGDDRQNPEAITEALRSMTQFYVGATGPFVLNESDDRENAQYDFWQVQKTGDDYEWQQTTRWEAAHTQNGAVSLSDLLNKKTPMDNRALLRMLGENYLSETP